MNYILRADVNHYQTVSVDRDEDVAVADLFNGSEIAPRWLAPPMHIHEKGRETRPPSDSPGFLPGIPLFSPRAVNVLKALLNSHGEFLPLNCHDQELYAFNVTRIVNGLDLTHSDYKIFPSTGRIMLVNKYVFISSVVENLPIFKIIQFPRGTVFVDDSFVHLIKHNKLTGFLFTPAEFGDLYWPPESKTVNKKRQEACQAKLAALERILGPMYQLVAHSLLGESLTMHFFPNGIPGTGFATMELIEPDGSGPLPNRVGTYELVAFTRHAMPASAEEGAGTPWGRIERRICDIFTRLASYSGEAVLSPGETCELPMQGELSRYLILDEYTPNGIEFKIGRKKHSLLLCLEVFQSEMEHARQHGTDAVIQKLKQAGHYPYSDLDRSPVC